MDIKTRVTNAFRALSKNSYPLSDRGLSDRFRRFGNERMYSDWSQTVMDERDKYTGFLYAALNNRANKVAMLGKKHITTTALESIMEQTKQKDEQIIHPYLEKIDKSRSFSNYKFWYDVSTFLDLKGRYYLLAVRNKAGKLTGEIQYFKLLNPYNVRRVYDDKTRELQGYVEAKDGMTRNIPIHMIIEIDRLNPFDDNDPYSMTDAAKDSQFTIKTAGDHTRHSVSKNRATNGILVLNDDELALDEQRLENFKARIKGKVKGEPIFGVGKGSISWNDMQIDLNKSALSEVNEVNLKQLIAVSGNSKTMFGIEESGVTRDSGDAQKNLFVGAHAVPQVQFIIDALNQDYKNYYETDYLKFGYEIQVTDPSEDNKDADIKAQSLLDMKIATYQSLRDKGYSHEVAAKYAEGKMELLEIDEPTEEVETETPPEEELEQTDNYIDAIHNQFDEDEQGIISTQQATLENAVKNVEQQATMMVMKKVVKNSFDEESEIIYKTDRQQLDKELQTNLEAFYLLLIPLYANRTMSRRAKEFGKVGVFTLNTDNKKYIKDIAKKTSSSHVDTILEDLRKAVQASALEGASQAELINDITSKYLDISRNRAKAIARTEMNRAFTQSQFQADQQFILQNGFQGRAYKKWITRSDNPCALCLEMASRPPVPFSEDFLEFGSELAVTYKDDNDKTKVLKQKIDYEPLEAGNLHVNCGCGYQLIIEGV